MSIPVSAQDPPEGESVRAPSIGAGHSDDRNGLRLGTSPEPGAPGHWLAEPPPDLPRSPFFELILSFSIALRVACVRFDLAPPVARQHPIYRRLRDWVPDFLLQGGMNRRHHQYPSLFGPVRPATKEGFFLLPGHSRATATSPATFLRRLAGNLIANLFLHPAHSSSANAQNVSNDTIRDVTQGWQNHAQPRSDLPCVPRAAHVFPRPLHYGLAEVGSPAHRYLAPPSYHGTPRARWHYTILSS